MRRELGHECHPSNWPWAFGLCLVEGPAGAFELDVQGGEVSPCALCLEDFIMAKHFCPLPGALRAYDVLRFGVG